VRAADETATPLARSEVRVPMLTAEIATVLGVDLDPAEQVQHV